MPIDYREMRFAEIFADLEDTLCDLYYNAGERHLASLILRIDPVDLSQGTQPSVHLIEVMEELYEYDANLRSPRAQELMSVAVDEIVRLASTQQRPES